MKKSILMLLVALGATVAFANSNLNWKISSSPYDFDLAGVCVYKGTTLVDIVGLVSASPVSPGTETEDSWVDISDYLDGYKFSIALFHEDADDIQPTYESVARYTYTDLLNRGVVKVSQMDITEPLEVSEFVTYPAMSDLTESMVGTVLVQSYTGSEVTPKPIVRDPDCDVTLVEGTDYTLAYESNIEPGTGTVTVTGIGSYVGTVTRDFLIVGGGAGTVTPQKGWKVGRKATWKAKAKTGSVFSHWSGPLADMLNLTLNELRNPTLTFKVPTGFTTNDLAAVFVPISSDGLFSLDIPQTTFPLKVAVSGLFVTDDSLSYVSASVSGLPKGLSFNKKTMAITGRPTKAGVYWAVVKAKNASGYQWSEKVKLTVGTGGSVAKEPKISRAACHALTISVTGKGSTKGTGVYAPGKKVAMKATAAKGNVFTGWYVDDACLSKSTSQAITMPTSDLVVTATFATIAEDTASVVADVGSLEFGDGVTALATNAMRGVAVSWPLAHEALSKTSVTVTGLPKGLKYDAKKKAIVGVPSAVKTTTAKIVVTTAAKKKVTFRLTVKVEALPEWACGNFSGVVQDDVTNAVATMTVGATGKISGKFRLATTSWTFSANSFTVDSVVPAGAPGEVRLICRATAKAKIGKRKTVTAPFGFTLVATPEVSAIASTTEDGFLGDSAAVVFRRDPGVRLTVEGAGGKVSLGKAYGQVASNRTVKLTAKLSNAKKYAFLGWFDEEGELISQATVYPLLMEDFDRFITAKFAPRGK